VGVLIEFANVVVRNITVEQRYPGGMSAYEKDCPNGTFCTDGHISRVGFMSELDAGDFVRHLDDLGLAPLAPEGVPQVVMISEGVGLLWPCDWLNLEVVSVAGDDETWAAWLRGIPQTPIVAPPAWEPGTECIRFTSEERESLEYLGTEDLVEAFRHKVTGKILYSKRVPPRPGEEIKSPQKSPSRKRSWWRRLLMPDDDDDVRA
jgi:hypothetical protein